MARHAHPSPHPVPPRRPSQHRSPQHGHPDDRTLARALSRSSTGRSAGTSHGAALRGAGRAASAAGLTAVLAAGAAAAAGVDVWPPGPGPDAALQPETRATGDALPDRGAFADRAARDAGRAPLTGDADAPATSPGPAATPELLAARRAEEAAARAEADRLAREAEAAAAAEAERVAAEQAARQAAAEAEVLAGFGVEPGTNRAMAVLMLGDAGWDADQWECLDVLWQRESNWDHLAENPSSGAYGIPQSLPAGKMAEFGEDYRTNPVTQIEWGMDYIADRYGTPCGAWSFWRANNWY